MQPPIPFTVSDGVVQTLEAAGIECLFLVPGKLVYPLLRAVDKSAAIRAVVAAHETGSAFMAEGYARASRKFGVCLGISGPGTMNFVPAMAAAQADQVPVLYIAGGIGSSAEGKGAFQDATLGGLAESSVVRTLVDEVAALKNKDNFHAEMRRLTNRLNWMFRSRSYISIPVDVQQQEIPLLPTAARTYSHSEFNRCETPANRAAIEVLCEQYLTKPKKIAFLAGSRANDAETAAMLLRVAEKYCVPVATTLPGKGAFPEDHPLSLGVFGFAGHSRAIDLVNSDELDALVVFGSDLNQRDSLNWSSRLTQGKELIIFDDCFDAPAKGHIENGTIFSGIRDSFRLLASIETHDSAALFGVLTARRAWVNTLNEVPLYDTRFDTMSSGAPAADSTLYPGDVVKRLCGLLPRDTNVVVDSGAHRIFMAHYWISSGVGNYLSSSSLAPMGWAIAAGVGVKLAAPDRPCMVVTGDGCMLMQGMEIQTAARYGVKVVYVVLNNSAHGAVHIDAISNGAIPEQFTRLPRHDWSSFAASLGVPACAVDRLEDLDAAVERAMSADGPFLIEVRVGVYPAPNKYYAESAAYEREPQAAPALLAQGDREERALDMAK